MGFPLGGCENQIAYSVFSRKNMKLAAGFIADSGFRFANWFPFRGLLGTRRSSYFVLENNCMSGRQMDGLREVWVIEI